MSHGPLAPQARPAPGGDSSAFLVTAPELEQLAAALVRLGCPTGKSRDMAAQLDKRARQLAEQTGRAYEEAMAHLLKLMQQGWAAKEKGA